MTTGDELADGELVDGGRTGGELIDGELTDGGRTGGEPIDGEQADGELFDEDPARDGRRDVGPTAAERVGYDLTDTERDMLAFERLWWRRPGAKERAIQERFGLSAIRYYQRLNTLLDRPAALAVDPVLVRRLQRLRADRDPFRG